MGFPDEIENFGSQVLGNVETNVEQGGIGDLTSVSGVEGILEKSVPGLGDFLGGGQQAAAPQSDDSGN